jgi:predicted phosphodiesterase
MRLHVMSDLHLEFAKGYHPAAVSDADLAIVPGDVGHSPDILQRLADWPIPIIYVPGNHEYDQQDFDDAEEELSETAATIGLTYLNQHTTVVDGVRFIGVTRWCDFDLFGEARRDSSMRAAEAYLRHMGTTRRGRMFDPAAVREVGLAQRAWLEQALNEPFDGKTVVITHFGPSARSADPRYGLVPGTASFCNADDDLIPQADLWIHGHLHCPHDYTVGGTRVVCNARGYESRGEHLGFAPTLTIEV